jgi:transcriptional regulator with XRE-family HTH domain
MKIIEKRIFVLQPDNKATGIKAETLREKAGLSLRAIARKTGMSAPYIWDLENGLRGWGGKKAKKYLDFLDTLDSKAH